jgi:hypothetical protein
VLAYAWTNERDRPPNPADDRYYDRYYDLYTYSRISTVALWTAGASLVVGGLLLRAKTGAESPAVALSPLQGGGLVSVGWQR